MGKGKDHGLERPAKRQKLASSGGSNSSACEGSGIKKKLNKTKANAKSKRAADGANAKELEKVGPTTGDAARKVIPQAALPWKRASLPNVAADAGGSTDAGFWETLYASANGEGSSLGSRENPDQSGAGYTSVPKKSRKPKMGKDPWGGGTEVWLGLEEIDGVELRFEDGPGGKKIAFVATRDLAAASPTDEPSKAGSVSEHSKVKAKSNGRGNANTQAESQHETYDEVSIASPDVGMVAPNDEDIPFADFENADQQSSANTVRSTTPPAPADGDAKSASKASEQANIYVSKKSASGGDVQVEEDLVNVQWAALDESVPNAIPRDFVNLPGWKDIPLHPKLKAGLAALGFKKPTPIQTNTISIAMAPRVDDKKNEESPSDLSQAHASTWRDIVGVAQTGSGKTLAYALPILHRLLAERRETGEVATQEGSPGEIKPLAALILTPTRELALQVSKSISSLIFAASNPGANASAQTTSPPFATLATVVGGMSAQKQARQLSFKGGADIIVATPGRLWETLESNDELAERVKLTSRALVLDEADRMMEAGHFVEMEQILRILRRRCAGDGAVPVVADTGTAEPSDGANADLQTYIFSATFSSMLQVNLKRGNRKALKRALGTNTLDELMSKIDFRDEDPYVADLSTKSRVAETVKECKIECLSKEKDLYLYYFLLRYPGRTLIFVNSIDSIRRIQPILTHLRVQSFPLHSNLQQRQRLRNLDNFRSANLSSSNSGAGKGSAVLLATDIAARGLDIPAVDHVVHYQIPRSADTYVHRSGRTGRAGRAGVSLAMVDPAEKKLMKQVMMTLKRSDDLNSLNSLPVEYSLLDQLRERLALAVQIDSIEHKQSKASHDSAWLKSLADEAGLDIDSDDLSDVDGILGSDVEEEGGKRKKKQNKGKAGALKRDLDGLLHQPLSVRGVSRKYITSGGADDEFVKNLLEDAHVDNMLGVKKVALHDALKGNGPQASKPQKRKG
ncbi:P-loop containing nucleoside triphosphate hydrolase protein [Tilletiaria anomala UBC 951]|uniref:ATP-dependent RNA helicase n=1 Tax=Tilletiaria anomala (strain ATCC 24038 / CBS 436.72 / UBC 951) TaxID=1037660 RepID=A0A066VLB3_TILAU|nr:P-loop containing nucleoside triphosphate hydrolase protein [Tilletiaria anomala UBC 951]KDN39330.1 P-loop containing nucleoside triphosphate hydrolase protein [Tilletiaria anomala UBC 951]